MAGLGRRPCECGGWRRVGEATGAWGKGLGYNAEVMVEDQDLSKVDVDACLELFLCRLSMLIARQWCIYDVNSDGFFSGVRVNLCRPVA